MRLKDILFKPSSQVMDSAERRKVQLFNRFLWLLLSLASVSAIIQLAYVHHFEKTVFIILWGDIILLLGWLFGKTRLYRIGFLIVIGGILAILNYALVQGFADNVTAFYFQVPLLLAAFFISERAGWATYVLVLLNLIVLQRMNTLVSGDIFYPLITYHAILSPLFFLFVKYNRRIQEDRLNRIHFITSHDEMTGLMSRSAFLKELNRCLSEKEPLGGYLLFLDMDNVKVVNDTVGHMTGDDYITQFASILKNYENSDTFIGRLGGDEFGILLLNRNKEDVVEFFERLRNMLDLSPFVVDDKYFDYKVSAGAIALHEENGYVLVSEAASSCYKAKDLGSNRLIFYHDKGANVQGRIRQSEMVRLIRKALKEDRFVLFRQKITHVTDSPKGGEPSHYEILIRMLDDQDTLLTPGSFLDIAAKYNLMRDIDRWVVQSVIEFLSKHSEKEKIYSINLSGAFLSDIESLTFLQDLAEARPSVFRKLYFEVTETDIIQNFHNAVRILEFLKTLGCSILLDDFGTGLSSLSYLQKLPIDYIKIDKVFVLNMESDRDNIIMIQAVFNLASTLGIGIIAEGIETETAVSQLKKLGIEYMQGFYYHRPEPLPGRKNAIYGIPNDE